MQPNEHDLKGRHRAQAATIRRLLGGTLLLHPQIAIMGPGTLHHSGISRASMTGACHMVTIRDFVLSRQMPPFLRPSLVGESEAIRRGSEDKQLESTRPRDSVQKRQTSTRSPQQVRGPRADICDEVRREARGCPFRALRAFEATLTQTFITVEVVIELFAGSCRWSRCVGQLGYYVLSIDMRFGVTNDLCKRGLQNLVLGWIQAGKVAFVLAAFPCQSFSKARNRPGGPPALRDSDHLTGLPGLRPCDQRKVLRGNECLYFCCRLAWACLLGLVPLILENPWTSWAWKLASMVQLFRNPYARFTRIDFCQFGTPWRKSTGFLTLFCVTDAIERTCSGKVCSVSRKPHFSAARHERGGRLLDAHRGGLPVRPLPSFGSDGSQRNFGVASREIRSHLLPCSSVSAGP